MDINVTAYNSKHHETVTPRKLESSTTTTKGFGHELDQSQAMIPEETVEMLVHPELRNTHTAPQQPVKQILVQLNKHVLQEFNKIKKLYNTRLYDNTCTIKKLAHNSPIF